MKKKKPLVIEGNSMENKNLLYAIGIKLYSSCAYIQADKKYLLVPSLDYSLAQKNFKVDSVINDTIYREKAGKDPNESGVIDLFLKEKGINDFLMPYDSSAGFVCDLKDKGYSIELVSNPFPKRSCKTKDEIKKITDVQRINEKAMYNAISEIKNSIIGKNGVLYDSYGGVLTSEKIKNIIDITFLKHNCVSGESAIVSCGEDSADPHEEGSGPLYANSPIIIDMFPCSRETGYFADMTRTVVKGKASKKIKEMYKAVRDAQKYIFPKVIEGNTNKDLTKKIIAFFNRRGFKTDLKKSKGFFHSLGHGLGLEIHESPGRTEKFKPSNVFTIEPGLYYPGIGGVRLEDLVVIRKNKLPTNLTNFPYELEI